MSLLKLLVTHLPAEAVALNLEHLAATMPGPVVVFHGGKPEEFARVEHPHKHFLEHPGLRGPAATFQSYDEVIDLGWREHAAGDPEIDRAIVIEFDQIPLSRDFEPRLLELMDREGADFLGKDCVDRSNTNWWHRVRYRDDPALMDHLAGLSTREDPTRIYGCLGSGFVMRRPVLEALATTERLDGIYNELYLPTLAHHLGFRVDSVDRTSDLYAAVRWSPAFSLEEAVALKRSGATVVHPFKSPDDLARLRAA